MRCAYARVIVSDRLSPAVLGRLTDFRITQVRSNALELGYITPPLVRYWSNSPFSLLALTSTNRTTPGHRRSDPLALRAAIWVSGSNTFIGPHPPPNLSDAACHPTTSVHAKSRLAPEQTVLSPHVHSRSDRFEIGRGIGHLSRSVDVVIPGRAGQQGWAFAKPPSATVSILTERVKVISDGDYSLDSCFHQKNLGVSRAWQRG